MSGALACLLVLAPSASAQTSKIPRGYYSCLRIIDGQFYYPDSVKIVDADTYRVDLGRRVRYAYDPETGRIKFVSGPYRKYFGEYSQSETAFRVYSKKTGRLYVTCDR